MILWTMLNESISISTISKEVVEEEVRINVQEASNKRKKENKIYPFNDIHQYECDSEEKQEPKRLIQERNKAGNQAHVKLEDQDDIDFAKDKEMVKPNKELNQSLAGTEVNYPESRLEVKPDTQIANQKSIEDTVKVLDFEEVDEGQ